MEVITLDTCCRTSAATACDSKHIRATARAAGPALAPTARQSLLAPAARAARLERPRPSTHARRPLAARSDAAGGPAALSAALTSFPAVSPAMAAFRHRRNGGDQRRAACDRLPRRRIPGGVRHAVPPRWPERRASHAGEPWLWVGPSGPHIIGKVVRELARQTGQHGPVQRRFRSALGQAAGRGILGPPALPRSRHQPGPGRVAARRGRRPLHYAAGACRPWRSD